MANIFVPIESVFSSILSPLTSVSNKATSTVSSAIRSSSTPSSSSSISSSGSLTASTSTAATQLATFPTSRTAATISRTSFASIASSTDIISGIEPFMAASPSTTTDAASTVTSLVTSTLSNPVTSVANPINAPPSSTSIPQPISSPPDNQVSTAGIVVAAIFAGGLLLSIIWLVFRYCAPIRTRYDTWSQRRRQTRGWREALDGPGDKRISPSSTQSARSFSFLDLNRASHRPDDLEAEVVHQQRDTGTIMMNSSSAYPKDHLEGFLGLGLGDVSPFRKANHDLPLSHARNLRLDRPLSSICMKRLPETPRQSLLPPPLYTKEHRRDGMSSAATLRLQIPETPTGTRVSQIGLAVTSVA